MATHVELSTIDKVAKRSGVGRGTVDRIRKAEVSTSLDNVGKLAEAFDVESTSLLSPGMRSERRALATLPRPDVVNVPVYDVAGSMGSGFNLPAEYVEVVENMTVSLDFLRAKVNFTSPKNLALITAYGNSMLGTFEDGDLLLVDRGVNEVKIDDVFVLAFNDELFIKRLQRNPDGTVLMISDNQKYKPYLITKEEKAKVEVLGRVLLAWNVNSKL